MPLQELVASTPYNYLCYKPHNWKERKWPLLVFLHGAGEVAKTSDLIDLENVKRNGIPKILELLPNDAQRDVHFPFFAISPQLRTRGWDPKSIKTIVDNFILEFKENVDVDKVYLTGISMGGFGTFKTAAEYPHMFAAIAPICGGCEISRAPVLRDLPIWCFHGAKDEWVSVDHSRGIMKEIKSLGSVVSKYTEYPDLGHDSWSITYENQELYKWFLSNSKENNAKRAAEAPATALVLPQRTVHTLEDKTGETLSVTSTRPRDLLYIRNCNDCTVNVDARVMKLVVENCARSTVTLNGTIMTEMSEIISCRGCTIFVKTMILTMQVDNTFDTSFYFYANEYSQRDPTIAWSKCGGNSMAFFRNDSKDPLQQIPPASTLRPEVDPESAQFRSSLDSSAHLLTELLIREGAGYATTEREKAENDARDLRNQQAMNRMMSASVHIRSRPS